MCPARSFSFRQYLLEGWYITVIWATTSACRHQMIPAKETSATQAIHTRVLTALRPDVVGEQTPTVSQDANQPSGPVAHSHLRSPKHQFPLLGYDLAISLPLQSLSKSGEKSLQNSHRVSAFSRLDIHQLIVSGNTGILSRRDKSWAIKIKILSAASSSWIFRTVCIAAS